MPYPPWYEDVAENLDALIDLPPNWDSYGSRPIASEAIGAALQFCGEMTTDTPRPRVVPINRGGVQLEWYSELAIDLELEIASAPDGHLLAISWCYEPADRSPDWARGVLARALHRVR